jgi:hypothetical protein
VSKLREEKSEVEKHVYDMEFVMGEKDKEIQKIKDESAKEIKRLIEEKD